MMSQMAGQMGMPVRPQEFAKPQGRQRQEGQEGRRGDRRRRRCAARSAPGCPAASPTCRRCRRASTNCRRAGRFRPVEAEVPGPERSRGDAARPRPRAARRGTRRVVDRRRRAARRAGRHGADTVSGPTVSTAAGSCPASSTRTATSGSAPTAPLDDLDEAIDQARDRTRRRRAAAARLRLADRHPQPRRPRRPAAHHPRRPPPGPAEALQPRTADRRRGRVATARSRRGSRPGRGDGWVKLVGDWIDREVGDLAPLWSDDVLKAAIDAAHANGARVTAHVFGEDALPGLIKAGIDCIEHGTGITDDVIDLMRRTRHRAGADADQHRQLPRHRRARGEVPDLRRAHARPVRDVPAARSPPRARPGCRSTPGPTRRR